MGFVTNDPKKGDEQQPGGAGLVVDLGLMACPQCRREVPEWSQECPDCGVAAVPKTSLASVMPDIPSHLLDDADESQDAAEDHEQDAGPGDGQDDGGSTQGSRDSGAGDG